MRSRVGDKELALSTARGSTRKWVRKEEKKEKPTNPTGVVLFLRNKLGNEPEGLLVRAGV